MTLSELVGEIDSNRQQGNLSSAIRLFVLDYFRTRAMAAAPEAKHSRRRERRRLPRDLQPKRELSGDPGVFSSLSVSIEWAESVNPMARTMRMTVLNSGLPVSPSALYRLSRFKPEFFAISPMPRAHAERIAQNSHPRFPAR